MKEVNICSSIANYNNANDKSMYDDVTISLMDETSAQQSGM